MQDNHSALYPNDLQKIEEVRERVIKSEREGTYATIDGVDTVDDIWYLLDMVRRLDDTVIHARGLMIDLAKATAGRLKPLE